MEFVSEFPNNTDSQKKSALKPKKKAKQESISLLPTHDANTQHEARNPSQTSATCTNGTAREETEGREGDENKEGERSK
jgi:hypothetical protein